MYDGHEVWKSGKFWYGKADATPHIKLGPFFERDYAAKTTVDYRNRIKYPGLR